MLLTEQVGWSNAAERACAVASAELMTWARTPDQVREVTTASCPTELIAQGGLGGGRGEYKYPKSDPHDSLVDQQPITAPRIHLINDNGTVRYSATDINNWLACAHSSHLDALLRTDPALKEWKRAHADTEPADAASGPAAARGDQHELAMLQGMIEEGLQVTEIPRPKFDDPDALANAAAATIEAMRLGADVVFQAALVEGPWFGYADFLVRVDGIPSALGDYCYEVRDTKLARKPSASALIQMAHYGAMVETIQGTPPPRLVIWLGTGELFDWPYRDAVPYLRQAQKAFLDFQAELPETVPVPMASCTSCRWFDHCDEEWGEGDLRNVHRLSGRQRELLHAHGIADVEALAAAVDDDRPDGIGDETFSWLREQAQVQVGADEWLTISPQPGVAGIFGTPPAHPLDIYFDLEGDPFAATPTLDYLWAYCDADGKYYYRWAHSPQEERDAFLWFLDELHEREKTGGDWNVYHYNTYEVTSMRRIAQAWPDEVRRGELVAEVDRLVAERFDDLYRRIDVGLRTREGSTSLKIVEKLAGYDRSAQASAVARADDSIKAYETFIASTDEAERAEILEGIRQYNVHDVRATLAVHHWLRQITGDVPDASLITNATDSTGREVTLTGGDEEEYEQSEQVRVRIESTAKLRDQLLAAAAQAQAAGSTLRSGLSANGARLLAEMLEWHRRESIVTFLDSKRLEAWALGQEFRSEGNDSDPSGVAFVDVNGPPESPGSSIAPGTEHESCLLDVEGPLRVDDPLPGKRSKTFHYRCRPGAWKVKAGTAVKTLAFDDLDASFQVELTSHDPRAGAFSFTRAKTPAAFDRMVTAAFFDPPTVWERLMDLAREALLAGLPDLDCSTGVEEFVERECGMGLDEMLASDDAPAIIERLFGARQEIRPWARVPFDVLDRMPPLAAPTMAAGGDESASDRARRIFATMPSGILPVQGPPGTGKTHLGSELIIDQLRAGGANHSVVVGVTANSHKVIDNLLASVVKCAAAEGIEVRVAHVGSKDQVDAETGIEVIGGGSRALATWLDDAADTATPVVVGATKFGWSRADAGCIADLLVIDEAGQLPLADAVAVCGAARRVVALGDPQQLAAPIQAAHDDSVRLSLLEHIIDGQAVMPSEAGVFLDLSYRMHPAVCQVVADLAYDGELLAAPQAAARDIQGPALTVGDGVVEVQPGVAWVPVMGGGDAEVAAVRELAEGLIDGAQVFEGDATARLTGADILVVAPHNAHVNRLDAQLSDLGVRVGTVDKFQGQQAHVVIYSMGRLATSPGDVPFLYELNRVNVALSRARLLAVVVSDPHAVLPPVNTPDQLRMASRFAAAVISG